MTAQAKVQDMTASGKGQGAMGTRGDAAKIPKPISAGPEMEALGRFYRDVTWKGIINEGGMGPGTPAMTGVGRSTVQVIQDGRWIVMDCEQEQFLEDGTFVLKRQLHWVSGWATAQQWCSCAILIQSLAATAATRSGSPSFPRWTVRRYRPDPDDLRQPAGCQMAVRGPRRSPRSAPSRAAPSRACRPRR
jgi:hypothetical protein